MNLLFTFVGKVTGTVRAVIGLVLPIFANAADFKTWPLWLKVMVQVLLLGGVCYGLYWLQAKLRLDYYLLFAPAVIRPYFLPLLFLLLVSFSWLAYGLWMLFASESEAAEFPDIQSAWTEAVARLDAEGLGIGDAPLFLLLGRPAAGLDALFMAAGVKDIILAPVRGESPIRLYAWDEAIFVTCPGASAWGKFCYEAANPAAGGDVVGQDAGGGADKTLNPGAAFAGMDPVQRAELEDLLRESQRRPLEVYEQARLRELAELANASSAGPKRAVSLPDAERSRQVRRFRYLCKLIRRDRRPWCPVNGALILVPLAATEADDTARNACAILEQELSAAHGIFQMRYPTFAMVCDLETTRGFEEFRRGFRPEMLRQRIGQRAPLAPAGDATATAGLIGNLTRWIGLSVLPRWILEFLRLEVSPDVRRTPGASDVHNRNLYLLMRAVFEQGPRLAELLSRGVPPVGGGRDEFADVPMFGGVYLAATGRDARQQAFVPGVFQRVVESQNAVSWSPDALAEDARLNRLTMLGYAGSVVLFAIAAGAIYWVAQGG